MMEIASLRLVDCLVWRQVVIAIGREPSAPERLNSVLAARPVVILVQISTETLSRR